MSWLLHRPDLLHRELAAIDRAYPSLVQCETLWAEGTLAFHGGVPVMTERGVNHVQVLIRYPDDFPYDRPIVTPLCDPVPPEPHDADISARDRVRWFSVRHQMPGGSICLFELSAGDDSAREVTGVDALARAEEWFSFALRGTFPAHLDSREADLQSHYVRTGDVLVGELGFASDLEASGSFEARRVRTGGAPLYIVTRLGNRAAGEADLAGVGLILDNRSGFQAPTEKLAGHYFTLQQEPRPIRTVAELARLVFPDGEDSLARLASLYTTERLKEAFAVVGLRYPARVAGAWDWLWLLLKMRDQSVGLVRAGGHVVPVLDPGGASDVFERAGILALFRHDVRRRALLMRNGHRVPVDIGAVRLTLLGAGALGSACAGLLARSGVGGLQVIDPQDLAAGNVLRHVGSIWQVGFPKAHVVHFDVKGHSPSCDVKPVNASALSPQIVESVFSSAPVLSTIADDSTELAVNARAVRSGTTIYYLRALRSGGAARMLRVRAGVDGCLECLALHRTDRDPRALDVPPAENEVLAHECGQAILAASAADLALVAAAATRQLLRDLTEPSAISHWVWTSDGVPGLEGLEAPFSLKAVALPRHPRCATCGVFGPTRVHVPREVEAFMFAETERLTPRETGGILVGRVSGADVEVAAASEAGPNAESSAIRFLRDGAFCQGFLDRHHRADPTLDYVGEWHSHPTSAPTPSARDAASLAEIAADPDYRTDAPIMIITGPDRQMSATCYPRRGTARTISIKRVGAG